MSFYTYVKCLELCLAYDKCSLLVYGHDGVLADNNKKTLFLCL